MELTLTEKIANKLDNLLHNQSNLEYTIDLLKENGFEKETTQALILLVQTYKKMYKITEKQLSIAELCIMDNILNDDDP